VPDVSQFVADFTRLHMLLSLSDEDPNEPDDPRFEAAIQRRLKKDPAQLRKLQRIASEVAKLVSD
jgi:hypothetical protein